MRPLTARSRFTSWLTTVFSAVALTLALIGIYGTMSYIVTHQTREIGIRIALGATAQEISRMVLGRGVWLISAGLVLGIIGGIAVGRGFMNCYSVSVLRSRQCSQQSRAHHCYRCGRVVSACAASDAHRSDECTPGRIEGMFTCTVKMFPWDAARTRSAPLFQ
jgi:ABC-type antimicrobial peptide transport system permease subunit